MYSKNSKNRDSVDCENNAEILNLSLVQTALELFDLKDVKITFKQCETTPFKTIQKSSLVKGDNQYEIYYPAGIAKNEIITPIIHEIAHVYQLSRYGSYYELKSSLTNLEIEILADFRAGYVYSKNLAPKQLTAYASNLQLVGLYKENREEAHGCPEQRSAAFRSGAFYGNVEGETASFEEIKTWMLDNYGESYECNF